MFRVLRWAVCVAGISGLLIVPQSTAQEPASQQGEPQKPRPLITVSQETTRILGPLDEHGYVDYVAALNQVHNRGVTPRNNANVLLKQAMGPGDLPKEIRARYFQILGMEELADEGDYFRSLHDHYKQLLEDGAFEPQKRPAWEIEEEIYEQADRAYETPWSSKQYPVLAGWLKANEKQLQLLIEASRRPRYYSPLVPSEKPAPMIAVLLPDISTFRNAARALTARAMLRVHEGRIEAAWKDLMVCRRLARLGGQGPALTDALVSNAIDGMAVHAGAALAHHGGLTVEQVRKFQAELRRLPPLPKIIDKIDLAERYIFLDAVRGMAQYGPDILSSTLPTERTALGNTFERTARGSIDWDKILRMGNSYYDRIVAAGHKPTRLQQQKAFNPIHEDFDARYEETQKPFWWVGSLLSGKTPRSAVSEHIGDILLSGFLLGPLAVLNAEDRGALLDEMEQLALAMAAYRADHGRYPDRLEVLAPKYINKIPQDVFSGGPLHFQRQGKGYLLYSVGPDGEDNDGQGYDSESDGDDIAIRVGLGERS